MKTFEFIGFMLMILLLLMCVFRLQMEISDIRHDLKPKAKYTIYSDEKPMDLGDGRFVIIPKIIK